MAAPLPGLFEADEIELGPGAMLLRDFAREAEAGLIAAIQAIAAAAPFRRMVTPGGFTMSAAMTNCGEAGWVTDRTGYRYSAADPVSGKPWPAMPEPFLALAARAALKAGYPGFAPDSCLINYYLPGARMSLHQDRQEKALEAPVVSVSLGLQAIFLWGGKIRGERPLRIALHHGDVVVWGGESRLNFHGIAPVKAGSHPLVGEMRYNMTFRKR
jgi:alkylated DNA repair protein (DNA oxidative demethylase)